MKKIALLLACVLSGGFSHANELCPDYDDAKTWYSKAKTEKSATSVQTLQWYQKAVELCPDLAEFQFGYGESLQRNQKYDEALVAYKKALQDTRLSVEQRIYTQLFMMKILIDQNKRVDAFIQQSDLQNLFKVHQNSSLAGAKNYFEKLQQALNDLTSQQPFNGSELAMILTTSRNLKVEAPEISYQIPFGYNQNNPTDDGLRILKQASQAFLSVNPVKIRVIGHTDLRGDAVYNEKLSERRAQAVVKSLERMQPSLKGKLVAIGKGESEPLSLDDNEIAHQLNRRVAFIVE